MSSQSQPLAGLRILVTRAAHQAGRLSAALRDLGAEPVEVPLLEIQPPLSFEPLDRALRSVAGYDWLLFTSANTVRAVAQRARELGIPLIGCHSSPQGITDLSGKGPCNKGTASQAVEELLTPKFCNKGTASAGPQAAEKKAPGFSPCLPKSAIEAGSVSFSAACPDPRTADAGDVHPSPRIAAVGAATAEALAREGLTVSLVPERYVAESLIEALSAQGPLAGQRILLARAEIARDVIPDALRAAGAHVDVADAYRNVTPANAAELLRAALAQPVAAALFTSSSTAEHLADAARQAGIPFPLPGAAAISIGPVTTQTLRDLGWPPAAEADPHDIPGLLAALIHVLS
jgi:uroporphyrinogen-III synthase